MHSRYITCFSILTVAGLGYASISVAQSTSTVPTSTPQTEITDTNTEASLPAGNTSTNITPALSTQKQERILNLATNIANRIDAAQLRLGQIANRIEQRQQKSIAAGYEVTGATQALSAAQTRLAEIKTTADLLDQLIYTTITSENPEREWKETNRVIQALKTDLQTVRDQLFSSAQQLQTALNAPTSSPVTNLES